MSSNLEQQADELEALQSIYTEEEFSPYNNERPGGHFLAHIDLPPNFQVQYQLLGNKYKSKPSSSSQSVVAPLESQTAKLESFLVSFLPPIELSFDLPATYPSEQKPDYILTCKWLTRGQLSRLCAQLDNIWKQQEGIEVLYEWTQFLKEEALKFLGITTILDISQIYSRQIRNIERRQESQSPTNDQGNMTEPKTKQVRLKPEGPKRESIMPDARAVLDLQNNEFAVTVLQKYSNDRKEAVFQKSNQSCNVCLSLKVGLDCIRFDQCGHTFCKSCIGGYFEVQIRDGNVQSLKCLEDKCDVSALPSQVRQVLSEEMFAKYDAALLTATLDTMMDIIYCPRRSCQYPVTLEQDETMGRCPSCQYNFCIYCKMAFHGLEPCRLKTEEQQRLVREYDEGTKEEKAILEKRYGRQQLQRLVDNALSEAWVSGNSQKCPHCNVSIEKSSGCNKMSCWRCNSYFCWICQAILDHRAPYIHFNDRNSRCFNRLFEGIAVDDDGEFMVDFEGDL